MPVLARILKIPVESYIVYLFIVICFGIIPVLTLLLDYNRILIPSLICFAFSIISLAGLLIFEGKNMHTQLKRKMHL